MYEVHCVFKLVYMYVEARGKKECLLQFLRQGLSLDLELIQTVWPLSSKDLPASEPMMLGLQAHTAKHAFEVSVGDLNSGPHMPLAD